MKSLFDLFISFFKIALFTYGGGYVIVMMIEREVCKKRGWLNKSQFLDDLAISQSAPGPISINLSLLIGYRVKGVMGVLTVFVAAALPSFVILIIFAIFFRQFGENTHIEKVFQGLRPAVVALVIFPLLVFIKSKGLKVWEYITVALVTILVTLGVPAILLIGVGVVWGVGLVKFKNSKRSR